MGNSASHEYKTEGSMKRLVLVAPNEDITKATLQVEEVDIPQPKAGEVLIRVVAAPVNPSDYGEWRRPAGDAKGPRAIGKEGSGIVVASNVSGLVAGSIVGKSVGFVNCPRGQGSYSEYVAVPYLTSVFPMPGTVDVADACSFFVNPYTVVGILSTCKERGSPSLVHTAACSQVGQMMVKLAPTMGVTLINVVRRQAQADKLKALGAEHVVVTTEENWRDTLKSKIKELKCTVAFDAIGGSMSGELVSMLPPKGACYCYGVLSNEPVAAIEPLDLIYRQKEMNGWMLMHWIKAAYGGMAGMVMRLRAASATVNSGLEKNGWATTSFTDTKLENTWQDFLHMWNATGFTDKKLRIMM